LANPALKPSEGAIRAALDNMHEVLRLRRSSPLFRLRSAADVAARVQFHNDQVRKMIPCVCV
jgi:pullulanase